jgi:16S rRNA G527 N7-methylase RsmG
VEKFFSDSSDRFDSIVSRAVAAPEQIWAWSEKLLAPGGRIYLMKGADISDELQTAGLNNTTFEIIKPESQWIDLSPYMESKRIVILERNNV